MFKNNIYIKMYKNKITARNVDSGVEVTELANPSFTTQRLLVGDFTAAEFAIKSLLKKVTPRWLVCNFAKDFNSCHGND